MSSMGTFIKNGKDKATCKLCKRKFSTKSTSSTQNQSKNFSQVHYLTFLKAIPTKHCHKERNPELKQFKLSDFCSRAKIKKKKKTLPSTNSPI